LQPGWSLDLTTRRSTRRGLGLREGVETTRRESCWGSEARVLIGSPMVRVQLSPRPALSAHRHIPRKIGTARGGGASSRLCCELYEQQLKRELRSRTPCNRKYHGDVNARRPMAILRHQTVADQPPVWVGVRRQGRDREPSEEDDEVPDEQPAHRGRVGQEMPGRPHRHVRY
jgi:hypothetical protein